MLEQAVNTVMAGLVTAIHVLLCCRTRKTWMPGTKAGHDEPLKSIPSPARERQIRPGDARQAIGFLTGFRAQIQDRMQALRLRKLNRLLGPDLEHAASHRHRAMPDHHDH